MASHRRMHSALVLGTASVLALSACSDNNEEAAIEDVEVDPPAVEAPFTEEEGIGSDSGPGIDTEELDGEPVLSIDPGLRLLSVSPRTALGLDSEIDDTRAQFVDYCFATDIQEVVDPTGFYLVGFDTAQRVIASGADLSEEAQNCVIAEFDAGTDISAYSLGVVRNSVVAARDDEVNVKDSEPITGFGAGAQNELRAGLTTAPELVSVRIDETLDQARFIFRESDLGAGTVGADAFGFYTLDGTTVEATEVLSLEENSAVVRFASGQLEDAVRFFVLPGAVIDRQRVGNNLGAFGARTAAPDLVSVERNSATQYDFTFDEPVKAGAVSEGFFLYTTDADVLVGGAVTRPDSTTVRVAFERAADFSDTIVRAAVAPGAVTALDADGIVNTIGAAAVMSGSMTGDQGVTSGPDLVDVAIEAETGRATFVFDETLIDEQAVMERFALITEGGDVSEPKEVLEVTGAAVAGNRIVVLFDEADAQAAALATVGTGAVFDQQGNPNPVQTLDVRVAGERS